MRPLLMRPPSPPPKFLNSKKFQSAYNFQERDEGGWVGLSSVRMRASLMIHSAWKKYREMEKTLMSEVGTEQCALYIRLSEMFHSLHTPLRTTSSTRAPLRASSSGHKTVRATSSLRAPLRASTIRHKTVRAVPHSTHASQNHQQHTYASQSIQQWTQDCQSHQQPTCTSQSIHHPTQDCQSCSTVYTRLSEPPAAHVRLSEHPAVDTRLSEPPAAYVHLSEHPSSDTRLSELFHTLHTPRRGVLHSNIRLPSPPIAYIRLREAVKKVKRMTGLKS